MKNAQYISMAEAAALEQVSYRAALMRLRRKNVVLANDPEDHRRKLIPVSALSASAYQVWLKGQAHQSLHGLIPRRANDGESQATALADPGQAPQPSFVFAPPTATECALRDAIPPAIPASQKPYIERWAAIVGDCVNGTFQKYRGKLFEGFTIRHNGDFMRALAHLHGIGVSTIRQKVKVFKQVNHDPEVPQERKGAEFWNRILPKNRPGQSGHSFFSDDDNLWMREKFLSFYLTQGKLSVKRAHSLLLAEIDAKQRVWGVGHLYQKPTIHQCQTLLKSLDLPTLMLARQGEKAFNDRCAPYIKRRPPEHSGEIVGTDGKLLDILCRDEGWRIGRIWWVPFADVASERWLGHAFGPAISGDMVMEAAAMMLEEACIPGAVQIDRGKEFQGKRFTGAYFKISGEKVFAEMEGMWERLGVKVISAIGRNPKTKPIERLFRSVREFEQSWPTYTGPNPQERPPRLALIERQIREFKAGRAPAPPVPTMQQVVESLVSWCTNRWNAEHRGRGRYRQGMTPDEAWNVKRPPEGFRTLTKTEVDYYTADHRYLKVQRGGEVQFNLRGHAYEYFAPELFNHQGETIEVVINPPELGRVTVIYPVAGGTASCVAELKDSLPWGAESRNQVRLRLKCIEALKRAKKQSLKAFQAASELLPEASHIPAEELASELAEKRLINSRQLFGTAASPQRARKHELLPAFNDDAARAVLETLEGQ